jgi:hypothetical protein
VPLKSWAWKYEGHDIRAEIWWRFPGWRRERVYIDHKLCAQWRGYSVRGPGLRCSLENDSGAKYQIEVRFRRPLWVRSPVFQVAAGLLTCQVLVDGVPWQWEPGPVRVQKSWINGGSDDGFPGGGVELSGPLGCIIFLLVFVGAIVIFPVGLCIGSLTEYMKELRLKSSLRRRGRIVDWVDAKEKMSRGPSTLIVEMRFLGSARLLVDGRGRARQEPISSDT